jgi:2Fe-2S ferredoxin
MTYFGSYKVNGYWLKANIKIVLPVAKIEIDNLFGITIAVSDANKSLLAHFHANQLDWMHACGAKGRCTTCKVIVLSGMENLSPLTPAEERYRLQKALSGNERLSCQACPSGDVYVSVPEEYKLPHVKYGH